MGWRDYYSVHPAADVFPMMSDKELADLGEDIKKNGQTVPIYLWHPPGQPDLTVLLDGRNRLEAMERAGLVHNEQFVARFNGDPVAAIIALNIHRRHLTKERQAELIVLALKAGAEASRQAGEVPKPRHVKGKAGSERNSTKAAALAAGAEHGISKRTVERAIAKAAEGQVREFKARDKVTVHKPAKTDIVIARKHYLSALAELDFDALASEVQTVVSRLTLLLAEADMRSLNKEDA